MTRLENGWSQLRSRSPILAYTGLLHGALIFVTAGLWAMDPTEVMGVNAWIKPMKFMVSITVYLWTVAWLIGHLEGRRRSVAVISWGIALAMTAETVCLFIQASRGTTSHYNVATAFDGAIFSTMGLMIALDSVLMFGLLLLFLHRIPALQPSYQRGIGVGILIFLYGGWVGGQMIANMAHTVGTPDGGPGLPFLNWSTVGGDLRIAHAMGLHALQGFPLLGFWLGQKPGRPNGWLWAVAALYLLAMTGAFLQAKGGQPLIAL